MLAKYQLDANWRLRLLNCFVDFKGNDIVLDAGCGDGFIGAEVAGKTLRVVGVDVDTAVIEHNKKTIPLDNIDFVVADATVNSDVEALSRKEQFSKIICLDAVEHMGSVTDLISNFAALLSHGGEVFITVPLGKGHGHEIDVETMEEAFDGSIWKTVKMKRIRAPAITAFLKSFLESLQSLLGYSARETDNFSDTLSFELERKNPPILRLYKLFFLLVVRPLTFLERKPFVEGGSHLVVIARKA